MKKIVLVMCVLLCAACVPYASHISVCAEEEHPAVTSVEEGAEAITIGNTIDPVTDQEIDPESAVTYKYEGKIYNFYSEESITEFKKYPDVYVVIVESELKAKAQEKLKREEQERLKPTEPDSRYNEEHLF